MKKSSFIITSSLLGILLLIFVFQQVNLAEIGEVIFMFPKKALFIVFFVNFLAIFLVGSYRWQVILRSQKCYVSFWRLVRAKLAGFTFSYVTPSALIAGEPVRAYMVKEESNCGWEKGSASVIIDQMIYLACLFCVIIIGFVSLADNFDLPKDVLLGFISIFVVAVLVFYLFYKKTFKRSEGEPAFFSFIVYKTGIHKIGFVKNKLKALENTEKSMEDFFKSNKKAFGWVVILAFTEVLFDIVAVMLICFFMGNWFNFTESVEIFSFMALANLVPIPGALGSSELALAFVFDLLGTGKDAGLAFSLIFRFVNIISAILGIFAFMYFMFSTISHSFSLEAPPFFIRIHKFLTRFINRK